MSDDRRWLAALRTAIREVYEDGMDPPEAAPYVLAVLREAGLAAAPQGEPGLDEMRASVRQATATMAAVYPVITALRAWRDASNTRAKPRAIQEAEQAVLTELRYFEEQAEVLAAYDQGETDDRSGVGYPALDVLRPYNGPCGICGGPDQRHRLADALVEAVAAGDSPEFLAEAYGLRDVTPDTIRALVAVREQNRKRRKYRWGRLAILDDAETREASDG